MLHYKLGNHKGHHQLLLYEQRGHFLCFITSCMGMTITHARGAFVDFPPLTLFYDYSINYSITSCTGDEIILNTSFWSTFVVLQS